jgi:branched-chain amino acid transport system permease protein
MPGLGDFWPYIIQGLAFGAMYAVTGTGLVVLFKTTGVVNLAFGAVGAISAHIAWTMLGGTIANSTPIGHGVRVLVYPAMVAICATIMVLYGVIVAPQLARRDPLVKALGMLGLALVLLGIMKDRWDSSKPRQLAFPTKTFELWGAVVSTTQVVALLFALFVVITVSAYLNHTATGTAMRAISNERNVASLLGVPVTRVETLAWFGSGVITGCAYLLLPSFFKSLDQGTLTWFIIGALGGAIVAQFRSLWITFFASLAIGVIESSLTPFSGNLQFLSDYRKTTPYVVSVLAIVWISRKRTIVLAGREMQ